MAVERDDLERELAEVARAVADPRAGIYGPGSFSWRIDRESALFLGGGRAILLQLAHPFVAYAVDQHSEARRDPLGRFHRTFERVFAMVFGDLEHALRSARRVHGVHSRVRGAIDEAIGPYAKGSPYLANDPDALLWVHATLIESAVIAYEELCGPLTLADKEGYYAESHRMARLFGIPAASIPPDWAAFEAYNRRMHEWLEVAAPARDIGAFLLRPPALREPVAGAVRLVTAALLPERLRAPFGFSFGPREARRYAALRRMLRVSYRALPERVRWVPAYHDAQRRLAGRPGRDPIGAMVERWVFGTLIGGSPPSPAGGGPGRGASGRGGTVG